jgi:hypothetical protein
MRASWCAVNDHECMDEPGSQSLLLRQFLQCAAPILGGDESVTAAHRLEALVASRFPEGVDKDDLLESLALYAPLAGHPYVQPEELRRIVGAAVARAEELLA